MAKVVNSKEKEGNVDILNKILLLSHMFTWYQKVGIWPLQFYVARQTIYIFNISK